MTRKDAAYSFLNSVNFFIKGGVKDSKGNITHIGGEEISNKLTNKEIAPNNLTPDQKKLVEEYNKIDIEYWNIYNQYNKILNSKQISQEDYTEKLGSHYLDRFRYHNDIHTYTSQYLEDYNKEFRKELKGLPTNIRNLRSRQHTIVIRKSNIMKSLKSELVLKLNL